MDPCSRASGSFDTVNSTNENMRINHYFTRNEIPQMGNDLKDETLLFCE